MKRLLYGWSVEGKMVVNDNDLEPNLMFFWLRIMNWLYINYQLDTLIIIYS